MDDDGTKYEIGDTFIKWRQWFEDSYEVFIITSTGVDDDQLFGDTHCINDKGVITHIHYDLSYDMDDWIPIPFSFYCEIVRLIDKAQLEALSILLRVKHEIPQHLQQGSCFVYIRRDGLFSVNQVQYFEAISDNTPGIHRVELLEEEGGEIHSKTLNIGNRTFNLGLSYILREQVDEDEDYIISKQAFNKIVRIHSKLIKDLQDLLDVSTAHVELVDGKWGYYDFDKGWEIPCQWTDASPFSEGLAAVANDQGKYGYINKFGECVIPCKWAYAWPFVEGFAAVENQFGYYYFINHKGEIAFPSHWCLADFFSEGYACVMDESGKWGFIDKTGKLVIPCVWHEADWFNEGKAKVWDSQHHVYLIDTQGKIVASGKEVDNFEENLQD